jgi:hypothetical protein
MTTAQANATMTRLDAQMASGKALRPAQQRQYDAALEVWTADRAARLAAR